MSRTISLKAIKSDVQHMLAQNPYKVRNLGLILIILLMLVIIDDNLEMLVLGLGIFMAILWQFRNYSIFKKKEAANEVIFFKKKKNERERKLYTFFTMMFFTWILRGNVSLSFVVMGIGVFSLARYILYIPSIIFKAEDYYLLIERGFKRSRIDFTYTNKIRFISHRMIFENVLDKKIEIKNIEYLSKLDELKEFLSDNFGREKVVSASNGQPLI